MSNDGNRSGVHRETDRGASFRYLETLARELRAPIAGLSASADLLASSALSEEQLELVGSIRRGASALLAIVHDVSGSGALLSGELRLAGVPWSPLAGVQALVEIVAPHAARKGLELAISIDPDVPQEIVCDVGRVGQVLLTLLNNAVRFTERGGVELRISIENEGAPDDAPRGSSGWPAECETSAARLLVTVKDSGVGMVPETVATLFDAFAPGSREGGLALSIARSVAELHGGTIDAASTPGVGSEFRFAFRSLGPVRRARDVVSVPRLTGVQVRVVSRSRRARESLESLLVWHGARIAVARSSQPDPDEVEIVDGESLALPEASSPRVIVTETGSAIDRLPPGTLLVSRPVRASALVRAVLAAQRDGPRAREESSGSSVETPIAPEDLARSLGERFPLRVLVAEDNRVNQKLVKKILERLGYAPVLVDDGQAAVDAFAESPFDLIVMDLQMPRLDGLAATREIRARPEVTADWPLILGFTAKAGEGDAAACRDAGMNDHVTKPVRFEAFVTLIERIAPGLSRSR